jgi:hypothetical protein
MPRRRCFRALLLSTIVVCASRVAAQDPVLYADNRTISSTFRDRGTPYAPTYLIDVDKQRSADDGKQPIADLGMGRISKYAFAVAGILTYGGIVDKNVTSSIPARRAALALLCDTDV